MEIWEIVIYKIEYNAFDTKKTFRKAEAYVDSITSEFIHFDAKKKAFVESRGLPFLDSLSKNELGVLALLDGKREFAAIVKDSSHSNAVVSHSEKIVEVAADIETWYVNSRYIQPRY